VTCSGDTCTGSGVAKVSCAASPGPANGSLAALGVMALGMAAAVRRKAKR